jgi:hypothetical protein
MQYRKPFAMSFYAALSVFERARSKEPLALGEAEPEKGRESL